ncbi:related to Sister chromatid cohesion protein 2 [Mycolicibacterium brisbanense]|uniref:Related to Sister chromatid cohesion protein 2 n=1 Tax=Mycolicibacterium brisbanense TaxID=146020 RepID=A0A100VVT6_9MYCO|nr:related to Sister chromatid cohesion protein 2 [Mycolicibacterium brisbanense]
MIITSVTYLENGERTVTVACSDCGGTHVLPWPYNGSETVESMLPCGMHLTIAVPLWCRNPRRSRTLFVHDATAPHDVVSPDLLNDNAIDDPVSNWTE